MNEAKKLGQLNMSVDEQIVARSTRDFARDLGRLVDQAKICRPTKTFSRSTSLSLPMIVQKVEMFPGEHTCGGGREARYEAIGTAKYPITVYFCIAFNINNTESRPMASSV